MIVAFILLGVIGIGFIVASGIMWRDVAELNELVNRIDEQTKCALAGFAANFDKVYDDINSIEVELKGTEVRAAEAEKEIKAWNDGLTNIMNYTATTAKGGVKKN